MELKVTKRHPDAVLPSYAHEGDAGLDLCALTEVVLEPGEPRKIPTGLSLELPEGYVALVWDKSGLSTRYALKTLGGVIDRTYRGEYQVGMINLGSEPYTFNKGDKIAQLLIQPIVTAQLSQVEQLSETERGEDGFGSTGS